MSKAYRIHGSEMSPYSVKVRSWFRYKAAPHVWLPRAAETEDEYRRVAKLPIVPTVVTPEGEGLQDSTPILERLERLFPEPSTVPDAAELAFLSLLLEEFGDEWGNKLMFHHRWYDDLDARVSARTLARLSLPFASPAEAAERAATVLARMSGRGHFVGSSPSTAPLITRYFLELLDLLEAHLARRRYLFGGRPALGDFGLAAQLYEASVDPTCGGLMRARAPAVLAWGHRMLDPTLEAPFEGWGTLAPTLGPVIAYVGRYFLPWSDANSRALQDGRQAFSVELPGGSYTQAPQKYHAKSLAALRQTYRQYEAAAELHPILQSCGCTPFLRDRDAG